MYTRHHRRKETATAAERQMKQREWNEMEYNSIKQTNKHETIQLTTFYENKRVKKLFFCFMKAKKQYREKKKKQQTSNDKTKQSKQ